MLVALQLQGVHSVVTGTVDVRCSEGDRSRLTVANPIFYLVLLTMMGATVKRSGGTTSSSW